MLASEIRAAARKAALAEALRQIFARPFDVTRPLLADVEKICEVEDD